MATMMSGVTYGFYLVAKVLGRFQDLSFESELTPSIKRYVYPLIAPPTPPQLEQDKAAIDDSFSKAFALLEQLSTDTEALKASEQARTERLDKALQEVESVIGELKIASKRREDEARRISDDVRGLKDLIPQAMDAQKESTDERLRDLNQELKSLKTLVGNRMGAGPKQTSGPANPGGSSGSMINGGEARYNPASPSSDDSASGAPVGSGSQSTESRIPSLNSTAPERKGSPGLMGTGTTSTRAAIPAWQMAAANKAAGSGEIQTA